MGFHMMANPIQMRLEFHEAFEQEVAEIGAACPAPYAFDQIQIRAIGGQPEHVEPSSDLPLLEESLDPLGFVDAGIVGDQDDTPPRPLGPVPQILDEHEEAPRDFPRQTDELGVSVRVLDRPEDELLAVLTGSGDLKLMPLQPPSPRKVGMKMTFGLVLVPELEVGAGLKGFFFRRESRFLAFRCASSSRFPLSVCLGRP